MFDVRNLPIVWYLGQKGTPPRRDDPRPPGLVLAARPPDTPTELGGYLLAPDLFEFWRQSDGQLHDPQHYRLVSGQWLIEYLAP